MYEFCRQYGVAHKKVGKLLIANDADDESKIKKNYDGGMACGVAGLRFLSGDEVCGMEPSIVARSALFSPETGILDTHAFMKQLHALAQAQGAVFAFNTAVVAIKKTENGYRLNVRDSDGQTLLMESRAVVNCAGLTSDVVAEMAGIDLEKKKYHLQYCKGQYFRLARPQKYGITHLVYPPATNVSLGIHITPDLAQGLRLGPDAVYVGDLDYKVDESARTVFFESVRKFLPALTIDELIADTSGIRPKLHDETRTFADFIIMEESNAGLPGLVNCIGIESPGLTASLAIGEYVAQILLI